MSKTIVFFDSSDPSNPGWAWRNKEASGSICNEDSCEALSLIQGGFEVPMGFRENLREELKSEGIDPCSAILVDSNQQEIGQLFFD